jgi:hypothetical protein
MAPPGGVPTWQHRRVGQQTQGPPGQTGRETVRWPGSSARPRGGDADPDPTLACSRAADYGGLDFPLRRLTTIRDGPSWRRDTLADPTTTEDPISRRSVAVYDLYRRALLQGLKGWLLVNNQHVSVSLQKSRSSGRPSEWPTSGALRSHAAPLATAAPADGLADKRRRRSPQTVASPHPCRTYGVARPAERLDSTALSRTSLIRMRPLVQVQPGPQNRLLTSGNAGRSASRWQPGRMHPVWGRGLEGVSSPESGQRV